MVPAADFEDAMSEGRTLRQRTTGNPLDPNDAPGSMVKPAELVDVVGYFCPSPRKGKIGEWDRREFGGRVAFGPANRSAAGRPWSRLSVPLLSEVGEECPPPDTNNPADLIGGLVGVLIQNFRGLGQFRRQMSATAI
jgi:hypothetical protein